MANRNSYQQANMDQEIQSPQSVIVIGALVALAGVALLGLENNGWRVFGGALTGALAGVALYHTSFGFTAAWRRIVTQRRGQGLRAQFVLISLVCLISFPLLQYAPLVSFSHSVLEQLLERSFSAWECSLAGAEDQAYCSRSEAGLHAW